jgi:hypothetical protein
VEVYLDNCLERLRKTTGTSHRIADVPNRTPPKYVYQSRVNVQGKKIVSWVEYGVFV